MTTSEPTTGEIVRALREVVSDPMFRIHEIAKRCRIAADRLESQEREIEELKSEAIVNALENAERIANLTARAESAERERDAVVELYVPQRCSTCAHSTGTACAAQGNGCKWKYRGLQPQDGEWK